MKNSELVAKFFKGMIPIKEAQVCIGEVISPPPELKISILDGRVILYPYMLYMNDRLFNDYTRQYKLEGNITEYSFNNTTESESIPQHPAHPIKKLAGSGTYKAEGTIINTCTLVKGDLVKVTPTENGQKWIVDFKIRKI
ncbi:DUF2577 family protein [uncultured Fusobacterium sp.]|uniref:DUF2577 family protein n=1 Tax=uncultured Fusobacterium sp. TaxID=159267 RepID=UPI0025F63157|nr:DUF2577 family protein [uncultured Fusobacterium sp.]